MDQTKPASLSQPCLEVFFDGACPVCTREVNAARRRDHQGKIRFVNIADPSFSPDEIGVNTATLNERIHARTREGQLITGVEVFRRLYAELFGERWIGWTRQPLVARVLDTLYSAFARNRKVFSKWVPMPKV